MRTASLLCLLLLPAAVVRGDTPLAIVAPATPGGTPPGVVRLLVHRFAAGDAPAAWPLVELFAPLPDATGQDLLASHQDWLLLGADGCTRLPGTPCYALREVAGARAAQVAALARAGAAGVCLSALPRADWPAQASPARGFGFNPQLVALFRERYHRTPATAGEGSLDWALLAGLQAEAFGNLLRSLRRQCPRLKLALACAQADLLPYSATGAPLDVPGYVREGLLDEVMVRQSTAGDLNALKLQTDGPLTTWAWCTAARPEGLRPALLTALRSPGVDGVVAAAPGAPEELTRLLREVEAAHAAAQAEQAALEQAIRSGRLKALAGCEVRDQADQATVHTVAQSFQLGRPATATAVGLLLALRGPEPWSLPPLSVTVRPDANGKPGREVLATATIAPGGLGAEPGYRWAYARLDCPAVLEAGRAYWLHAADPGGGANSYLWRLRKGGGFDGGHAWSSSYDYTAHDWAFEVYAEDR